MNVLKIVLLAALAAISFFCGISYVNIGDETAALSSCIVPLLVFLIECVGFFYIDRYEQKRTREDEVERERREREHQSDKTLFDDFLDILPERTMEYIANATPETSFDGKTVHRLCDYKDVFRNRHLNEFHNCVLQKSFEGFNKTLDEYIQFTSKHFFIIPQNGNFTLRQMADNGIEKDIVAFEKMKKEYYVLCDAMVEAYIAFIKEGKKQLSR